MREKPLMTVTRFFRISGLRIFKTMACVSAM